MIVNYHLSKFIKVPSNFNIRFLYYTQKMAKKQAFF